VLERKRKQDWQRLVDETLKLGRNTLFALDNAKQLTIHSTERACPRCSRSFAPIDPKIFSYNSAQGWCPNCRGFGELFYLPDVDRGARADAIEESWFGWQEGSREICPDCQGARLNPVARAVRLCLPELAQKRSFPTIDSFAQLSVQQAFKLFKSLRLKGRAGVIARDIIPEIRERLKFLDEVGLGYLQLGRGVTTLSGGEAQRIRLAAQLGSNLSGVLYISRRADHRSSRARQRATSRGAAFAAVARQFARRGRARRGDHAPRRLHHRPRPRRGRAWRRNRCWRHAA